MNFIDKQRLYFYLKEEDIFSYYLGDLEVNSKVCSPVRKDNVPSFQLKYSKTGNLYWVDYGMVQKNFDSIELVAQMFGLSREEAIEKIWQDMVEDYGLDNLEPAKFLKKETVPYTLEVQPLRYWELSFWKKFFITEETLEKYNVKSLKGLYREEDLLISSEKRFPTYVYLFPRQSSLAFKTYRPNGDIWKWRGQDNSDIIEGWEQLPKTDSKLIITSSLKDVMVLSQLGYSSCAPSSENSHGVLLKRKEEINSRFKEVSILFDSDPPGIKAAQYLSSETGWKFFHIPTFLKAKDPSDLVKNYKSIVPLQKFLNKRL